jgi:hypothetical protein
MGAGRRVEGMPERTGGGVVPEQAAGRWHADGGPQDIRGPSTAVIRSLIPVPGCGRVPGAVAGLADDGQGVARVVGLQAQPATEPPGADVTGEQAVIPQRWGRRPRRAAGPARADRGAVAGGDPCPVFAAIFLTVVACLAAKVLSMEVSMTHRRRPRRQTSWASR